MTANPLRLMCVLAHPDDESLGTGGVLALAAAQGIETYLLTATRGVRGRIGEERPGPEIAGPIREGELRCAARTLGVREIELLGYHDGDLDRADPRQAISRIAAGIRRRRPHVVVTFPPDGIYGHPDHVAISQFTGAAIVAAADPGFVAAAGVELPATPWAVAKLYWFHLTPAGWESYRTAFKDLTARVDGVERRVTPWPEWAFTTFVDARSCWEIVWRAIRCHHSQIASYAGLAGLPPERHEKLWGSPALYRVFSLVNGGRARETDLFDGLR
ncbi:MAG: PIG-L family deacetylase [Thermoanaerobaculia bacterium]|nr:MAG: PIG-L family deacetylase [Thermoanaerobaculia bacterium]